MAYFLRNNTISKTKNTFLVKALLWARPFVVKILDWIDGILSQKKKKPDPVVWSRQIFQDALEANAMSSYGSGISIDDRSPLHPESKEYVMVPYEEKSKVRTVWNLRRNSKTVYRSWQGYL